MKEQKGITLIALIITIIVMLILVGVTINVALNGGLFERASKAKDNTQRETDREQLIAAVVATVDDNGNFNLGNIELPEGFVKTSEGRYKNTNNNKEYTVDAQTGNVKEYTGEEKIPQEEGYSFTIGALFNKATIVTDFAGSVSASDFLMLVEAETLDELNEYYDENDNLMKFNTSNSSVINLSSWDEVGNVVSPGKYALGLMYDGSDQTFKIVLFDSDTVGGYESEQRADKEIIDAFADTYASVKITLQPLGE